MDVEELSSVLRVVLDLRKMLGATCSCGGRMYRSQLGLLLGKSARAPPCLAWSEKCFPALSFHPPTHMHIPRPRETPWRR
jgi:hypothetical protein